LHSRSTSVVTDNKKDIPQILQVATRELVFNSQEILEIHAIHEASLLEKRKVSQQGAFAAITDLNKFQKLLE
jgi:hypothetical protein